MSQSFKCEAIVLKRMNYAEADRIVTFFTLEKGKLTAIAKGVRKLTSKKKSSLEPATQGQYFFVKGKTWHILTQTQIINSHSQSRANLTRLTQTYQILEIIDLLSADEQDNPDVYQILVETLDNLDQDGQKKAYLISQINLILQAMGFASQKPLTENNLKDYIESIAERNLKSKAYLTNTHP